jgi:hypothetical protein
MRGRAFHFLESLFAHALATLRDQFGDSDSGYAEMAAHFRAEMTAGQTFAGHNAFRVKFYEDVIETAKSNLGGLAMPGPALPPDNRPKTRPPQPKGKGKAPSSPTARDYDSALENTCEDLIRFLRGKRPRPKSRSDQTAEDDKTPMESYPLIILAFDEAHTLTNRRSTDPPHWSNFSELRHALRSLHRFSCFSLFMSTTGKTSQFTPAKAEDNSMRVVEGELVLIPPFTDLGFDTLAQKVSFGRGLSLEKLASLPHMARLGRPLYVLFDSWI